MGNENQNALDFLGNTRSIPTLSINNEQGIITIHGYKEWYIYNPKVQIYDNGVLLYEIRKDEVWKHRFDKSTILTFKTLGKTAQIEVNANENKEIYLSLDRYTGSLIATSSNQEFSQSKSIVKNYTNEEYQQIAPTNSKKKKPLIKIVLIIGIILGIIYIVNTPENSVERAVEVIENHPYKLLNVEGNIATPVECKPINELYHCSFQIYNDNIKQWVTFKYLVELNGYSWHYEEIK